MTQVRLCRKEIARRIGRSLSLLKRDVKSGRLIAPVNPSGKPKGQKFWYEADIEAYQQRLYAEREQHPVRHDSLP